MAVNHSNYEAGKIENLLQRIKNASLSEQKQEYEIYVDGMKVVPRTSDPQLFESHSDFINEDSNSMTVLLFKGGSRMNDKYFFYFKEVPKKEVTLSGLPGNMTLSEYDAKQKEDFLKGVRLEQLEKENSELKSAVSDKDNTIEQLSTRLQEMHEGKLISIGEMGSAVFMRLLQHPKMRETFPVLEGLAPNSIKKDVSPEEEATFSRKDENKDSETSELTEEEQRHLILIHDLQERLNNFQLASVMHILDILTRCPEAIGSTLKHLSNWIDTHKNNKEDEKV